MFHSLCGSLDWIFDSVDTMINKCRQSVVVGDTGSGLDRVETSVVHRLATVVNSLAELSQSGLEFAMLLDHFIRVLTKFYAVSDNLAKYFYSRCKGSKDPIFQSDFALLVENTDAKLTKSVFDLLPKIEVS